jgi:hypothetical protein
MFQSSSGKVRYGNHLIKLDYLIHHHLSKHKIFKIQLNNFRAGILKLFAVV